MKKIFTLFAVALVGLCAFAQDFDPYEGCDSKLGVALLDDDAANNNKKVVFELQLTNHVDIMNGFEMFIQKSSEDMAWANIKGVKKFSPDDYIDNILGNWTEQDGEPVDNDMRKDVFTDLCDVNQSVKNGGLMVIFILKTMDGINFDRTFPQGDKMGLGKFALNMSNCADGDYSMFAKNLPGEGSFSYLGVPHYLLTPNPDTFGTDGMLKADPEGPMAAAIKFHKEGTTITQVPLTGIDVVDAVKNVTSVKYYNLQGVESATPFDGVNIVVKTYEDGTKAASKIVK